jgi:hypothetical protein
MQIPANSKSVSISIWARALNGSALEGKTAADFDLTYRRSGGNIPISLVDLDELTDDWRVGGILEVGNGEYRLDPPNEAFVSGVTQVTVSGTVNGGVVLGYPIGIGQDVDDIISAMAEYLGTVEVRREISVLGPCSRPVTSVPAVIPRKVRTPLC